MVGGCELPMTTTASNRLGSESSDSRDGGPECCYVDLGYRGHDVDDIQAFKACQKRGVTRCIRCELERRNERTSTPKACLIYVVRFLSSASTGTTPAGKKASMLCNGCVGMPASISISGSVLVLLRSHSGVICISMGVS